MKQIAELGGWTERASGTFGSRDCVEYVREGGNGGERQRENKHKDVARRKGPNEPEENQGGQMEREREPQNNNEHEEAPPDGSSNAGEPPERG